MDICQREAREHGDGRSHQVQPLTAGRPEKYGLPTPNHRFFEAHPTRSVELPLRPGSGDVVAKGDIARLDGDTVWFTDSTAADFDVTIHATGYNITLRCAPTTTPG